jgi:hypothetical protein
MPLARVRIPTPEPLQRAIGGQSIPRVPPNPRAAAIAALYEHAAELAMSGDLAGARSLHEAIGLLLGCVPGAVGDLTERNRGRDR